MPNSTNRLEMAAGALAIALCALHCNSGTTNAPASNGTTGPGASSVGGGAATAAAGSVGGASSVAAASVGGAATAAAATPAAAAATTGGLGTPLGGYFESGAWHGYAWTSPGEVAGTTVTPDGFDAHEAGMPFCVSGSVAADPDYGGVALLGFNVNQAQLPEVEGTDPPILDATPSGLGIAVNFSKSVASTLRIQIQGLSGETDANDRWCYEIAEPAGPAFAPYAEFNTECWTGGMGTAYAGQPIAAVVFLVPGSNMDATEYGYCVDGFADGNSVADAPESLGGGGQVTGTISEDTGKVKVVSGGKSYIVQNNNWGPSRGVQTIDYSGASFTVSQQTGTQGPNYEPASFPSIYIGANGFQGVNGSLTTTGDDNLPIMISSITSIQTSFSHNNSSADANATYDVWFASAPPTGEYGTAGSGFLMVWTHDPANHQPIGQQVGSATLAGQTWNVWQGDRGDGSGSQVVSYVAPSTVPSIDFDLNEFIQEAVASSRGGFQASWYLTDVFVGFEIWGGGQGLSVSEFSAVVQ